MFPRSLLLPALLAIALVGTPATSQAVNFTVTTTVDEDNGTIDPGTGAGTSLREAINAAEGNGVAEVITFDAALGRATLSIS
jgi:CSLREA domain-containing protein